MLTNAEQRIMRQLISTPQWSMAEELAKKIIDKIKEEAIPDGTEWDVIRSSLSKEYRIRGIQQFVQEIYQQAQNATSK